MGAYFYVVAQFLYYFELGTSIICLCVLLNTLRISEQPYYNFRDTDIEEDCSTHSTQAICSLCLVFVQPAIVSFHSLTFVLTLSLLSLCYRVQHESLFIENCGLDNKYLKYYTLYNYTHLIQFLCD
jgi:hypothetical protein